MLIRNMKTAEENDFELPDNLQAQLREYQKNRILVAENLMPERLWRYSGG